MTRIQTHDLNSAPDAAREHLARYLKTSPTGKVLNLHGAMAHSPLVLEMYARMRGAIEDLKEFDSRAEWAAMLAAGTVHRAAYSSTLYAALGKQHGLTDAEIQAIAQGRDVDDPSINAAIRVAREIASNHGRVDSSTWDQALAAGWSDRHLAELFAYVGFATYIDYFVNYSAIESDLTRVEIVGAHPSTDA